MTYFLFRFSAFSKFNMDSKITAMFFIIVIIVIT